MKARFTKRKLEVFSIHAFIPGKQVDYKNLFKAFSLIKDEKRSIQDDEKLIAIPSVEVSGDLVSVTAYEGKIGQNPLIFNATNAEERIEKLRRGEIVATKTHVLIDLDAREAIVEYNHAGAKIWNIADVISRTLQNDSEWEGLNMEFNPVVDEEFVKAIDRFQRIRLASLRVSKPNPGWTDYANKLNDMAGESDAKDVEVTVTSNRGQSLSLVNGVVKYIKDLASGQHSLFKGAKITGNRQQEVGETTVSLKNHVSHQKVRVKMDEDGQVVSNDITDKMNRYSTERRQKRRH